MLDLVLKGGRVIDPGQQIDAISDVGFLDGRVARIAPAIDSAEAGEVRDVSGLIIVPGLIDLHTHVYWGGTSLGIDAEDFCRRCGVTTAVDTGSTGPGNFIGFRRHVIDRSEVRILAFLHVSFAGIYGFDRNIHVGESEDMRLMAPHEAMKVANAHRDVIVGIKVRLGRHASGFHGVAPLDIALQVAEETGLPVMAHIDEPPPTYVEVLAKLRPGDVLTHAFRPFPNAPCTYQGRIRPEVMAARERGVLFDIGHGMGSFAFKTARTMLANGFQPDTISSDVHSLCIDGPAYDQTTTLSKFLCMGMPIEDVVRASSYAPANALGRPDLGSLEVGSTGDATVLSIEEGNYDYVDVVGEHLEGRQKVFSRGVVINGRWWWPET